MTRQIRIGVIGAGRIGKIHTENIVYGVKGAEVKYISDLHVDQIKDWAGGLGVTRLTADYREILADPEIDAVIICSSTDTHSQITIESANAKKHIFCEKPIDYDINRIKKALDAVEKAGVKFQVGFNRRFDHNFKRVHDLILEGKIGEPHIIRITSRDPAPPPPEYVKVSGGMFLDMTIHDFDMARYLSGSEVVEVYASGAVLVDPEIGKAGDIDTAVITMKFKNGALGVIDNSRRAVYGYDQRVEVFGSRGCVSVSNDTDSSAVLSSEEGVFSEKPKYFFLERYMDSFAAEMRMFVDSIINNSVPAVTGIDGLKPVLIGLAAKRSLAEGKPVRLEE